MKIQSVTLTAVIIAMQINAQTYQYPQTKKVNQSDNYFGTEIKDPYRWLEDDRSKETAEWVQAENSVTEKYLSKIPFREKIKSRLTQLWNFPKASTPFKAGKNYFMY